MKRKKKSKTKKLKELAWYLMSVYTRLRDGCTSVISGKKLAWREAQAMHYKHTHSHGGHVLDFYEPNINTGSRFENCFGDNDVGHKYAEYIKNRWGENELEKKEQMYHEKHKFTTTEYDEIIDKLRRKIHAMNMSLLPDPVKKRLDKMNIMKPKERE